MKLYIEFTRPAKFKPLSWLIRVVQRSPYSHVRLRWTNSVGVDIIYEASGSQVKFIGPIAGAQTAVTVTDSIILEVDKEEYRKLVKVCMTYAGLEYGILQLMGIGLAKIFRLQTNPLSKGSHQQVCSELVGRVISEILGVAPPINWDLAGPKEIHKWLLDITQE